MGKIYTREELLALGFYYVPEGDGTDAEYLQFVENEDDYFNSPYQHAEQVGENDYVVTKVGY